MQIEGIVEQFKVMSGWAKDFRVRISGNDYYMRVHPKEKRGLLDVAKDSVNKRVVLEYQDSKTRVGDWIIEILSFASFGVPRKYKEIEKIMMVVDNVNRADSGNREYVLPENKLMSA